MSAPPTRRQRRLNVLMHLSMSDESFHR